MFESLYDNCTKAGLDLQQLKSDIEKKTGEYFKVGIPETLEEDINFDWWIVESK